MANDNIKCLANRAASLPEGTMMITVLDDGRIKIETGDMGQGATHVAADGLLAEIKKLMGGDVETEKLKPTTGHHHGHHSHRV